MNAILLGAASLGALIVAVSREPAQLQVTSLADETGMRVASISAETASVVVILTQAERDAADDAEVARLMEAAPDEGSFSDLDLVDAKTGQTIKVSVLAFND